MIWRRVSEDRPIGEQLVTSNCIGAILLIEDRSVLAGRASAILDVVKQQLEPAALRLLLLFDAVVAVQERISEVGLA